MSKFGFAPWLTSLFLAALILVSCSDGSKKEADGPDGWIGETSVKQTVDTLVAMHGDAHRSRIEKGVRQASARWREEDGTAADFLDFCRLNFLVDPALLDQTFARFEHNLMLIDGYLTELRRDLGIPLQLDTGPILPVDLRFGEFAPEVHALDDLFATKLAFVALLNFPLSTLQERLEQGASWTRRQWAETRLAQRFDARVPSSAQQQATTAYTAAENYISSYNIHMRHVLDAGGQRLFPEGLVLISHWGLRDELKAQYPLTDGLPRQKLIMRIMERIITQEIPKSVIDNPEVDWNVEKNTIVAAGSSASQAETGDRESDTRYEMWLGIFHGERAIDSWVPGSPTHIARRFNDDRELPEENVEKLLVSILSSPLIGEVAQRVRGRLGRELAPFDIWYPGFKPKPPMTEIELDKLVASRYPTVRAFEQDIPSILRKLGFDAGISEYLSDFIAVDASRGAGHAMGSGRITDKARLRTRVPAGGMNFKGYNIAIHELGHNVEQVLSYQKIDHTLLRSVPNTAFTEGFAFVFQTRDLELLGLRNADPLGEALVTLDVLWSTYEIAGVALVDMRAWRWLYEHPDATPAQFRDAVISIAKEVWNTYYAPVFGTKDVTLLAIYSHMVNGGMYTPDYPLGHIIAFQIEQFFKGKKLATEMERMCGIGNVSPDLWMRTAVGAPISTQPLLDAAREALKLVK